MPRQGLTRKDVLQACFRLIDEKGFEGFSMRELAHRLNIRPASLYNHIEDEKTLLLRVGQTATRRFSQALDEATAQKSGAEKLAALAFAWRDYARAHPGLYAVAMRAAKCDNRGEEPAFFEAAGSLAQGNEALRDLIVSTLCGYVGFENAGVFDPAKKPDSFESIVAALIGIWERSRV